MNETCTHDTQFVFLTRGDPLKWYVRAECAGQVEGCRYQSDGIEVLNTYGKTPVVSFSLAAELHIGHLIYSRDEAVIEPEPTCNRCGHAVEDHWEPGTGRATTACLKCLASSTTTTFTDKSGRIRTGICDHLADYVRSPW